MKRVRTAVRLLTAHLLIGGVVLGCIRVLQTGYNTTHREQVRMASLNYGTAHVRLSILDWDCELPAYTPDPDSPLYLAAYLLTEPAVHLWVCMGDAFMNRA